MERILLLNDSRFPNKFSEVDVLFPTNSTKTSYVESSIIKAINEYNPKLDVCRIEYAAIETQFTYYKKSNSSGVIVEEFEIPALLKDTYINNGCYVYKNKNQYFCRKIMLYLFISGVIENTRTAFISQTVFPSLLEYAEEFIKSPSYTIANHKFCFINILTKPITSSMILRHLSGLCASGIDYIEVFQTSSIHPSTIPSDLYQYIKQYSSDFTGHYNTQINAYEDDNYHIDFFNKKIIWRTASMISKLKSTPKSVDFNGSAEKFYWIEILPLSIFAYDNGYTIDYSEYENFINLYSSRFSSTSDKFKRCETLLKYAKKYFI